MIDLVMLVSLFVIIAPIVVGIMYGRARYRARRHDIAVARFQAAMERVAYRGARRRPKADPRIQRRRTARTIDEAS